MIDQLALGFSEFRDTRGRCTTVTAHKGRDIAPPLLRQIAKDIGMSLADFGCLKACV